ncbi:MAG: hypothetical protein EXR75_07720 [Myxococcales bacterium]|nr:hypothetical protein [Myxococcales bacterium]
MRVNVVAGLALALLGCSREQELSLADCAAVRVRVERAFTRDALEADRASGGERHTRMLRDEERRIGDGFAMRCKERVGERVAVSELECLGRAEAIEDVLACRR